MIPKFRAWDKEQQRWCPYRIYSLEKLGDDIVEFMYIPQGVWYKNEELFDNFILMQSTGLKDKNGVEIYEGDVIRDIDLIGRYDGEAYEVVYNLDIHHPALMNTISGYETNDEVEVLGNIYENPELLEAHT